MPGDISILAVLADRDVPPLFIIPGITVFQSSRSLRTATGGTADFYYIIKFQSSRSLRTATMVWNKVHRVIVPFQSSRSLRTATVILSGIFKVML